MKHRYRSWLGLLGLGILAALHGAPPVAVDPVTARQGLVVAGHPQAAAAGLAVLKAGGNAMDAAVATSLALGVAEPYGSGLGGKLMLLYYEAASGRTLAVDAMDAAATMDVDAYRQRPAEDRSYGYGSVCVPGLAAGLWAAHQRWGRLPWEATVTPAIRLAEEGFEILPKTLALFTEQEKKLRRGDAEIARLYLPGDQLPALGSRLPNPDLARVLERLAREGRDGFYRGPVAERLVAASERGGGLLTREDLAGYEARFVEPIGIDFRGYRLVAGPPPTTGGALYLTILKALESESWAGGPLRTAANLDRIGRVWLQVLPRVQRGIGDAPEAWFNFEKMVAPDAIREIRERSREATPVRKVAWALEPFYEDAAAATTHFAVVDGEGNVACATQSLSLHFGAGVVAPGTGVVLNNTMSNFSFYDPASINALESGKRSRSTIAPTLVLHDGRPLLAIGIPGASRIPTALLQVLLDRLVFGRPLEEAIGDTRVHYLSPFTPGESVAFEAEQSFPEAEADALRRRGWKVELREPAGTGRYFGGINAIELHVDGTLTGYADPRRTNAAVGY